MHWKLLLSILIFFIGSIHPNPPENNKNMEMAVRITSDHNFRGYNYGMSASQRNNTPYSAVNFVPAIQPQFIYSTPLKGLKTLFWANFFLNNLKDRDNDLYILQDTPGGEERYDSLVQNPQLFNPKTTKRYKERNGLLRSDGIFFGIYYEWDTQVGRWSVGTWVWNNTNRFGKFSWQEYFIWYEPPVLKFLNPKFYFFLNTSFDNGGSSSSPLGITNGQNYISYEMSYEFCKTCSVHIVPKFQLGYVSNNDNTNRRSGISNMIQSLSFVFGAIDVTLHALYRPDPILYDTYDANRSDGRLPNPAKQYGVHKAINQELVNRYPKEIADSIFYGYGSQKFVKMSYYISAGYSLEF